MCARSGSLYVRFFPFSEAERHCSGNPDWNEASALDYVRLIVLSHLVSVCVCVLLKVLQKAILIYVQPPPWWK
jgi:hypothetical protein